MNERTMIPVEISLLTMRGLAEETFRTQVYEYPAKGDTVTLFADGYYGRYEIVNRLYMLSHAPDVPPRVILTARFIEKVNI